MSVKVMGLVWDLTLPSSEKLVLLAYADHADHDGNNIWPSVDLISRKTGLSRRTVQRTTAKLQKKKLMELYQKGGGTGRTNRWRIPLDNLQASDQNGATVSPLAPVKVPSSPRKVSSDPSKGVTMTPEPSLTIINHPKEEKKEEEDPSSISDRNIFALYEDLTGRRLTEMVVERLKWIQDEVLDPAWIPRAFRIAADNGVTSWPYVRAILERWIEAGEMSGPPKRRQANEAPDFDSMSKTEIKDYYTGGEFGHLVQH